MRIDIDNPSPAMQGLGQGRPSGNGGGPAAGYRAEEERWPRWKAGLFAVTISLALWGAIALGIRTFL